MYRKTGAIKSRVLRSGSGGERSKPLHTYTPIKTESNVRQWRVRNGKQGRGSGGGGGGGGGRTLVRFYRSRAGKQRAGNKTIIISLPQPRIVPYIDSVILSYKYKHII